MDIELTCDLLRAHLDGNRPCGLDSHPRVGISDALCHGVSADLDGLLIVKQLLVQREPLFQDGTNDRVFDVLGNLQILRLGSLGGDSALGGRTTRLLLHHRQLSASGPVELVQHERHFLHPLAGEVVELDGHDIRQILDLDHRSGGRNEVFRVNHPVIAVFPDLVERKGVSVDDLVGTDIHIVLDTKILLQNAVSVGVITAGAILTKVPGDFPVCVGIFLESHQHSAVPDHGAEVLEALDGAIDATDMEIAPHFEQLHRRSLVNEHPGSHIRLSHVVIGGFPLPKLIN